MYTPTHTSRGSGNHMKHHETTLLASRCFKERRRSGFGMGALVTFLHNRTTLVGAGYNPL